MNLFIYTAAADKSQAAVTSLVDTTPVADLEQLVLGDNPLFTVKFTDGTAAPDWAGDDGYSLSIGLGQPDSEGILAYTSSADFTPVTGGWQGRVSLDTQALITALSLLVNQGPMILRPPTQRYAFQNPRFAWFVLQVKVTDPDGNAVTYANLRVAVLNRVLRSPTSLESQYPAAKAYEQELEFAAELNWDVSLGAAASVTLTGAAQLNNPTNVTNGLVYIFKTVQDGTGGRVTSFGSNFVWPGGTQPTPSSDPDAVDVYTFFATGGKLLGSMVGNFQP